ncbi:3604_t:CDS:1, partial [Ambispora gerdemannii]
RSGGISQTLSGTASTQAAIRLIVSRLTSASSLVKILVDSKFGPDEFYQRFVRQVSICSIWSLNSLKEGNLSLMLRRVLLDAARS